MTEKTPWGEGWDAYYAGIPDTECPYKVCIDKHSRKEWLAGWDSAERAECDRLLTQRQ